MTPKGIAEDDEVLIADDTQGQEDIGSIAHRHKVSGYGLPSVRDMLNGLIPVQGFMTLECMAGEATLSLALCWASVPCFCLWDLIYGKQFDVLNF